MNDRKSLLAVALCSLLIVWQAGAFNIGDRVQSTTSGLNIRSSPNTSGTVLGQANTGDRGTVGDGPYSGSGYTWYYVTWDTHPAGYSIQDYLALVANQPPTHGIASQVRADTGAVIPDPNGTVPYGVGVYFRVTPTDPEGDTVRMEVELHQLPASFTGTPNYVSPYVASGTVATTATATGLPAGNYGWRYRVVDSGGHAGAWVNENNPDFVVQNPNQPPTHGIANQVRADTGAVIADPNGTVPYGVGVFFRVTPTDPDGDNVRMEVELHQLPASFSGTPNYVSPYVASGTVATTATATGLAAGNYGWRYRVVDSLGNAGTWVNENNPDFVVQNPNQPPTHGIASQVRADTGAVIADPNGTVPFGVGVYFRVTPTDPDGDTARMEVELHQLPATFTGTPNYVSPYVASGTVATTATATGLAVGNYGWRYRVVDSLGHAGAWVNENNPDFIVQATLLPPPALIAPGTSAAPGSDVPTTTPQFQWQAVAGADGYALYISKLNGVGGYDLIYDSSAIGGPLAGASYTLPSGYLFTGGQYRWNMATHNSTGYGNPNASRLYFSVAISGGSFYLSFPLQYNGWTPYTAQIVTVFDHAMSSRYTPGGGVVAYTGEAGTVVDPNEPPVNFGNGLLYSFKKLDGTPFVINGHYVGTATTGNATLNYDGHPGYDYPVPVGTDVYAAADGQVIVTDANTTAAGNYVRVQHNDSGFQSQYLHLSQILVTVGQSVTRSQLIGRSGNTAGPGVTVSPHLHFEVKKGTGNTAIAVDPYGWTGGGSDPYTSALNVNLWNPVVPTCTYSLSPAGAAYGSSAASGNFTVATSAGCSWLATTSDGWVTITSGSSGSGNGLVGYSITANGSATPRTATITVQSQPFTISQAGVGAPVGYPSATWKGPAAVGNYETGRGGNSINKIILHTTEGSAQSALDRFQSAGEIASSHYIITTSGAVWQIVADPDTAYHSGNYGYNQQSIGIELEGWADGNPVGTFSWQTDAQFTALQNLITWLLSQYSIPLDRAHIIGHNQVPSPGSPYPPTTQWGGASNHYDNGAWWNWRRLMTALGHAPSFTVVQVQSATSLTTLPQSGAPIIAPATVGQKLVAYDSYGGYYLVFVSGSELPQQNLPAGGEFHWDGWISAANVTLPSGATQLEVGGVFPNRLNIRNAAGTTGTTIIARTIDGKRYVATGNTASADGFTWREFYITSTNNTVATGWSITDNLTVLGGGGGASSPTISSPNLTGTTFTLSVPTQVGFSYVLEFKNSLNDVNWTSIQTNNGTGGTTGLTDTGAAGPSRIYRVRVQ